MNRIRRCPDLHNLPCQLLAIGRQCIATVSCNTAIRILAALCLAVSTLLTQPGIAAEIYRAYDGPALQDSRVAILEALAGKITYQVDGAERKLNFGAFLDYDWIHLLPGPYHIELESTHRHSSARFNVDLKAGHTYRFESETCFACTPRKYYRWLEDSQTKEILWGTFPVHKFEERRVRERTRITRVLRDRLEVVSEAAHRGEASAQYQLGAYYLSGIHPILAPDSLQAYVWFTLAEGNGSTDAGKVKQRVALDMTPQALAEAHAKISAMNSYRRGYSPDSR